MARGMKKGTIPNYEPKDEERKTKFTLVRDYNSEKIPDELYLKPIVLSKSQFEWYNKVKNSVRMSLDELTTITGIHRTNLYFLCEKWMREYVKVEYGYKLCVDGKWHKRFLYTIPPFKVIVKGGTE